MTRNAKYTDLREPTRADRLRSDPAGRSGAGQCRRAHERAIRLALAPAVREAVRELDATLPLFDMRSQVEQAQESVARETLFARLSGLLGSIALMLVAVGLYGTMAYCCRTTDR